MKLKFIITVMIACMTLCYAPQSKAQDTTPTTTNSNVDDDMEDDDNDNWGLAGLLGLLGLLGLKRQRVVHEERDRTRTTNPNRP